MSHRLPGRAAPEQTFWPWRVLKPLGLNWLPLFTTREYRHAERIPEAGPVILVSNHLSLLDPLLLCALLWDAGRVPRFLAKRSIWKVPGVGFVMRATGQIPVDRAGGGAVAMRAAEQLVSTGASVVMYPEATLTRDPEMWPMKGKTGTARLALESGAPVIPVAHWGVQALLPPYGRFRPFPRKHVVISVGEPMDLTPWRNRPVDAALLADLTEAMMTEVTRLQAELRGEEPPARRWDVAVDGDPYQRDRR